jgi:hypothetical protein
MREIAVSNMYGEADATATNMVREMKNAEWDSIVKNYMVRRIQFMYRLRRARRWRWNKAWKVTKRFDRVRLDQKKFCVIFIERSFAGRRSRERFRKQLWLSYEKIWDTSSGRLFWFNHVTNKASWEMPLLLKRYGDCPGDCLLLLWHFTILFSSGISDLRISFSSLSYLFLISFS